MLIDDARALFPGAAGYLNTATMGLPPKSVVDALSTAIARWQDGTASPTDYDPIIAESRELFAELLSVPTEWVTVGAQVSALVGLVAGALEPGSTVLCVDDEFTSVTFPFAQRPDLVLKSVPLAELADAIAPSTSLVAVSAVQSKDGQVADLAAIREAAGQHGVPVMLDATQAVGWLPIDARDYDAVIVGAYKWLLSPRGTAFMSLRPSLLDRIPAVYAGWFAADSPWEGIYGLPLRLATDARRLDLSPAWLNWVGTLPALQLIRELGVSTIHQHDVGLASWLRAALGLEPADSAIVSLDVDPSVQLGNLRTSMRGGRLRVGFHLYNCAEDVDRLVGAVRR